MQGILFSHMETVGAENYLRNTILYNGIGLLLILGLLYGNYMKLVRFSYGLTALFIAAGLAGSMPVSYTHLISLLYMMRE